MGIDWEEILGAEGDEIQDAYDKQVNKMEEYLTELEKSSIENVERNKVKIDFEEKMEIATRVRAEKQRKKFNGELLIENIPKHRRPELEKATVVKREEYITHSGRHSRNRSALVEENQGEKRVRFDRINYVRGNILRKNRDKTLYLIENVTKNKIFIVTNKEEKLVFPITEEFKEKKSNKFFQLTEKEQKFILDLEKKTESEYNANTFDEHQFYINWAKRNKGMALEDKDDVVNLTEERLLNKKNIKKDSKIFELIKCGNYNNHVLEYIHSLSGIAICQYLVEEVEGFMDALFTLAVNYGYDFGADIAQKIEENYKVYNSSINASYENWDVYAIFSYKVLNNTDDCTLLYTKEALARVLKYVAIKINRYSAQRMIANLIKNEKVKELENIL